MSQTLFEPKKKKDPAPDVRVHESWKRVLRSEFEKEQMKNKQLSESGSVDQEVEKERKQKAEVKAAATTVETEQN